MSAPAETVATPSGALREIDAEIARVIFGETTVWHPDPYGQRGTYLITRNRIETAVPRYTTDMGAAWTIFDQIGGHIRVETHTDGWACSIGRVTYHAETAPLAICRAALAAAQRKDGAP